MKQLTPHFSLAELTRSQAAIRHAINNVPTGTHLQNLKDTAAVMEVVREILGKPITISSGYRCPALNRRVGGSNTSAHCHGLAVDFDCDAFGTPDKIVRLLAKELPKRGVKFDQIIEEFGAWVHLGIRQPGTGHHRQQVLKATKNPGGGTQYSLMR